MLVEGGERDIISATGNNTRRDFEPVVVNGGTLPCSRRRSEGRSQTCAAALPYPASSVIMTGMEAIAAMV